MGSETTRKMEEDRVLAFKRTGIGIAERTWVLELAGFEFHSSITICGYPLCPLFFHYLSGYSNAYLIRLLGGLGQGILCLSDIPVHRFFSLHFFFSTRAPYPKETARPRMRDRRGQPSSSDLRCLWPRFRNLQSPWGPGAEGFREGICSGSEEALCKAAGILLNGPGALEKPS